MGRRMKEEPSVHRSHIAQAAGELFQMKGIESTSMNEIAAKAGYSKATLYVYFENKDEIIGYLVLQSMTKLQDYLATALHSRKDYRGRYLELCNALVQYEEEYPLYFSMVLDHINIDFEHSKCEESERETFQTGEEINQLMGTFFVQGIESGAFKRQLDINATIFTIWGMLSGFIQLAEAKKEYISQEMHQSKNEFLEGGFQLLYEAIRNESEK